MYVEVAVLKETQPHERRVALVPSLTAKLVKRGARLSIQTNAGCLAVLNDAAFESVTFVADRLASVADADVVLSVQPPALEGYDVRPETREQAKSLGAGFVETGVDASGDGGYARPLEPAEIATVATVLMAHIQQADLIITTAAIPGKRSPKLITTAQTAAMKPGSVIGANDVVNPAARNDKASPVFGMPILNADRAGKVYVSKRGQGKGYAGIQNALFYGGNCGMVYADVQAMPVKMIEAIRSLGLAAAA